MSRSRLPLAVQRAAGLQVERRVHFGISLLRSIFSISGRVIGVLGLLFVLRLAVDWRAGGWARGTNGSVQPAALLSGSPVPVECLCEDENFCFKGLDERGAVRWGRRFDCGLLGALRAARLTDAAAARTPSAAERMAADERWTPVFVSAVSSNHFREARNLLFGEERGAVHLGYADDWAALSEDLVAQVERRRLDALQKFFKLVSIRREDRMDAVLRLNCSK
ncbi:hypothetical protein M3Y99_00642000 [Aphelenchoides fujianensis]|nr:hypothetical protein M3Y99_00642000 [Aphelenchoides fujianensis]